MIMLVISTVLTIFIKCTVAENLVIKTAYGLLKGTTEKNSNGHNISVFYGIPYAEAPVGKLRLMVSFILKNVSHLSHCEANCCLQMRKFAVSNVDIRSLSTCNFALKN